MKPQQREEVLEYDDFLDWTVSSLKDFLSLRGFKQTDRKSELVARANLIRPQSRFRKNRFISKLKRNEKLIISFIFPSSSDVS